MITNINVEASVDIIKNDIRIWREENGWCLGFSKIKKYCVFKADTPDDKLWFDSGAGANGYFNTVVSGKV